MFPFNRWIAELKLGFIYYQERYYVIFQTRLGVISRFFFSNFFVRLQGFQISDAMLFRVLDVDFEIIICQTIHNTKKIAEQFSPLILLSRVARPRTPSLFHHQQMSEGL